MDHDVLLEQLVAAVRHVGGLEKQVADQLRIVELLEQYGRDTTVAKAALATLERECQLNSARRHQIRVQLED